MPTSTLIDAESFNRFSDVDISAYEPARLAAVFQVAHNVCTTELNFDPAIQLHVDEEGLLTIPVTGRDMYQSTFRLKHKPLLSRDPAITLTHIALTFPAPFSIQTLLPGTGIVPSIVLTRTSGLVRIPFLGLGGLPIVMFQNAGGNALTAGPTGYLASYYAGYAITADDVTAFPLALPVPADMQQAASLITEVLLGQNARVGENVQNAATNALLAFENLDYSENYNKMQSNLDSDKIADSIFAGSQQGMWALQLLSNYKKTQATRVMLA